MFLLGHSCWSYILSKLTGQKLKINFSAYLAFLGGVLPDFDIYVHSLFPGFQHHTWTHSLLTILPSALLISYYFGKPGIAFSAGILSHLLTDSLVGSIPLLYPVLPSWNVGLRFGIPSLADTILEMEALAIVILYAIWNGDYKLVFKPSRESLLLAIPLVAIVTLTLLFAGDTQTPLVSFAFSRRAASLITAGHVILAGILSAGVFQGLRWYLNDRRVGRSSAGAASRRPGP